VLFADVLSGSQRLRQSLRDQDLPGQRGAGDVERRLSGFVEDQLTDHRQQVYAVNEASCDVVVIWSMMLLYAQRDWRARFATRVRHRRARRQAVEQLTDARGGAAMAPIVDEAARWTSCGHEPDGSITACRFWRESRVSCARVETDRSRCRR